jgi:hypothetical protein
MNFFKKQMKEKNLATKFQRFAFSVAPLDIDIINELK